MDRKYQFYFLYKEFFKKIYAILYVWVFCLHIYTHTTCMPSAEVRRGCWILQKWSYRQLLATMWVLGIEYGVFARTLWINSSAPSVLNFLNYVHCVCLCAGEYNAQGGLNRALDSLELESWLWGAYLGARNWIWILWKSRIHS